MVVSEFPSRGGVESSMIRRKGVCNRCHHPFPGTLNCIGLEEAGYIIILRTASLEN